MTGPRFDLHAMRYGRIVSNDLPSPYSEAQCAACAYGHRCCDMVILVTPAEVAGILQWLEATLKGNVMGLIRTIKLRASVLREHFNAFGALGKVMDHTQQGALDAWFAKGLKCVFYDKDRKRCGIYPVRPLACRKTYGSGLCSNGDGVKGFRESDEVTLERVRRYYFHPKPAYNLVELTTLVEKMLQPDFKAWIDLDFFSLNPDALTDREMMFGPGKPIAEKPAAEPPPWPFPAPQRPLPSSPVRLRAKLSSNAEP